MGAAIGIFGTCLHCPVRTIDREVNAGDLLQRVLGSRAAGGHHRGKGSRIRDKMNAEERAVLSARERG